jgi:hypothetical protein
MDKNKFIVVQMFMNTHLAVGRHFFRNAIQAMILLESFMVMGTLRPPVKRY